MKSKLLAFLSLASLAAGCTAAEAPDDQTVEFRCGYVGQAGLIGLEEVVVSGNPAITGPNATLFSNERVTMAGSFEIEGDVISGGIVDIHGGNVPDGRIVEQASRIDVPDPTEDVLRAKTDNDNAQIPCVKKNGKCLSPVSSSGALTLASTQSITLPAGEYYFTSISVSGQAKINIDGEVVIYLAGGATLNGGSSTNPSADSLTIVSSGKSDIKLNGNADSQMAIYAPFATVRFSGTQGFHGTALGRELHISGTADLEPSGELTAIDSGPCGSGTNHNAGDRGAPDRDDDNWWD
jgi:hypothetical protein